MIKGWKTANLDQAWWVMLNQGKLFIKYWSMLLSYQPWSRVRHHTRSLLMLEAWFDHDVSNMNKLINYQPRSSLMGDTWSRQTLHKLLINVGKLPTLITSDASDAVVVEASSMIWSWCIKHEQRLINCQTQAWWVMLDQGKLFINYRSMLISY